MGKNCKKTALLCKKTAKTNALFAKIDAFTIKKRDS